MKFLYFGVLLALAVAVCAQETEEEEATVEHKENGEVLTKQFSSFNHYNPYYSYYGHQHWGYPSYPWNYWGHHTHPTVPKLPKGYSIWYPNPWNIPILVPTTLLPTLPTVNAPATTEAAGAAATTETEATPAVTEARAKTNKGHKKLLRVPYGYYGFQ